MCFYPLVLLCVRDGISHTEQKQHQKTKQVLSETVGRIKANVQSMNQRAHEKDAAIHKLQNRLALYEKHLARRAAKPPSKPKDPRIGPH